MCAETLVHTLQDDAYEKSLHCMARAVVQQPASIVRNIYITPWRVRGTEMVKVSQQGNLKNSEILSSAGGATTRTAERPKELAERAPKSRSPEIRRFATTPRPEP